MILLDDIEERIYYGGDRSISYDDAYRKMWTLWQDFMRQIFIYDQMIEGAHALRIKLEGMPKS